MSNAGYEVQITPAARKSIDRLSRPIRERVEAAIEALADQPRPSGVKKMKGMEGIYRIRVGNYRILYRVFDRELIVLVVDVGDRKDVYKG